MTKLYKVLIQVYWCSADNKAAVMVCFLIRGLSFEIEQVYTHIHCEFYIGFTFYKQAFISNRPTEIIVNFVLFHFLEKLYEYQSAKKCNWSWLIKGSQSGSQTPTLHKTHALWEKDGQVNGACKGVMKTFRWWRNLRQLSNATVTSTHLRTCPNSMTWLISVNLPWVDVD